MPDDAPMVEMNFYWFGKLANRLPEAAWLSFHPAAPGDGKWYLEKTNELISPLDVVPGGNRHMHAVSQRNSLSQFHD